MMKKCDAVILGVLAVTVGFMYVSGLPLGLIPCSFADIDAGCIPNFFNVMLCLLVIYAVIRLCKPDIHLCLTGDRLAEGLKDTLPAAGIYILGFIIANTLNSLPLGNTPTPARILIEGLVTVFFAAFLEELLLRGLLITFFTKIFRKSKHVTSLSVIISAIFFAIGHVPSVINQGLFMCLFRFAYPFCMGVLFGAIYRKYGNLWLPVIYHVVLNCISMTIMLFAASPVTGMKPVAIGIIAVFSVFGGIFGIVMAGKQDKVLQFQRQ